MAKAAETFGQLVAVNMWLPQSALIGSAMVFAGCQPLSQGLLTELDLRPPTLLSSVAAAASTLTLAFNEWVEIDPTDLVVEPDLHLTAADGGESVELAGDRQQPGVEYRLSATARDAAGNTTWFVTAFWGHNPALPDLVINELTTQGTATRPDAIELFAVTAGNLGGVTLFDGVADDYRDRVVMPPIQIAAGEYVVIHATENGMGENERTSADESVHPIAIVGAWDLWFESGGGLSGNNGVLTLFSHPEGELLDAVLYSNRTSSSDERYRGFGSRAVMERVDELSVLGGWVSAGERITPEEAVGSSHTTSTRSMSRGSDSADTDSAADWHTVPTRGATFGAVNSDDRY